VGRDRTFSPVATTNAPPASVAMFQMNSPFEAKTPSTRPSALRRYTEQSIGSLDGGAAGSDFSASFLSLPFAAAVEAPPFDLAAFAAIRSASSHGTMHRTSFSSKS
jgi:hypothetical protein